MRALKQTIKTYTGLGDPGSDHKVHFEEATIRANTTIRCMKEWGVNTRSMIDIAGPSHVGKYIAEQFGSVCLYGTSGDLDNDWRSDESYCDTILMLEVIEHIFNPLKVLNDIREKINYKDIIVSWPSRPSWLWTDIHFHEMRLDRFEALCDKAAYQIVNVHKGTLPEVWHRRFTGIRPFFRSFVNTHYIVHIR